MPAAAPVAVASPTGGWSVNTARGPPGDPDLNGTGGNDDVTIAYDGGTNSIVVTDNATSMVLATALVTATPINVLLGAGNDTVTIGDLGPFAGDLTVDGQDGYDTVTVAGNMTPSSLRSSAQRLK